MKRSQILSVAALVLLVGAGATIAHLLQENFNLKVERATLKTKLEAAAKAVPAPPAKAAPAAVADGRSVGGIARRLMDEALAAETGAEKKLWVRVDPKDREASSFASQIAAVFRDAKWEVQVLDNQGLRFKPGLLVLIGGDDEPPSYVRTAQTALGSIGEEVTTGTGYLAYYETKKRETPDWNGTAFLPGQTYLLVVGRKPEPVVAAPDVSTPAAP